MLRRKWYSTYIHAILAFFIVAGSIVAIMFNMVAYGLGLSKGLNFSSLHHLIGFIVLCMVVLQFIGGIINKKMEENE